MRQEIKKRILKEQSESQYLAAKIRSNNHWTEEEFKSLFFSYMCFKLSLKPEEVTTDNFYEICQISAEKIAKLPHGKLDAAENASKCGGATTAMNKKILFLLAVNREYQIKLDADDSIQIDTFTDLTNCVYKKLKGEILEVRDAEKYAANGKRDRG